MSSPLRFRLLGREDLPFADSLRAVAGWNQTLEDWKRFLAIEPNGCFLAEWNGAPAGTATTIVYGQELAWIGMVLVHPEFRRRGIGQGLLRHCIDSLHNHGVRCIKLDATPLGKTVYDGLGFRDEWTLKRWVRSAVPPQATSPDARLRPWRTGDEQLIGSIDTQAFGVSRQRLLAPLASQSRAAMVLENEDGRRAGFGLVRSGSQASYLGPVVATTDDDGIALIEGLVASTQGQRIYWDVPDENAAAVSWAEQNGFTVQRPLTRMFLGDNFAPGDPRQQFALAGPEVG